MCPLPCVSPISLPRGLSAYSPPSLFESDMKADPNLFLQGVRLVSESEGGRENFPPPGGEGLILYRPFVQQGFWGAFPHARMGVLDITLHCWGLMSVNSLSPCLR